MKVPRRIRTAGPKGATGPLNLTCPECEAAKGWPCVLRVKDADGIPYVRRTLRKVHAERRDAWRNR